MSELVGLSAADMGGAGHPVRFKIVRSSVGGQFGISSVPPGEYYVIAVREEDAADWRDPAVLDLLARAAARVTILEGEHRTLDLQVREVRR